MSGDSGFLEFNNWLEATEDKPRAIEPTHRLSPFVQRTGVMPPAGGRSHVDASCRHSDGISQITFMIIHLPLLRDRWM